MNKKGFTLVELLAVVVILALIATLASTSIINVVKTSKSDLYDAQIELIKEAAKAWGAENLNLLPNSGKCKYITLNDLKEYGLLDKNMKNPNTNKEFENLNIKITSENTKYGTLNIEYIVDSDDVGGCDFVYALESFETDSWNTIVSNVRAGKKYKLGDTKEITLTSTDTNISGTYKVRVANISTPTECSNEGFSQTACGFVIEFVDIISREIMNSGAFSIGGWEYSDIRDYVNNDIYNSLPLELKNNIISTTVVSGHSFAEETNLITTDKLYLLSPKEVFGKTESTDKLDLETRQLDYYKNTCGITTSCSNAIKNYNSEPKYWWLRSVYYDEDVQLFFDISSNGHISSCDPQFLSGVSPAFRIG